jgi:acylphosphatase
VSASVRRIVVSGRVQGVGFRYALADEARSRGVRGWVRNRSDGSVEAMLAGDADAVDALLAWTRIGPPSARVSSVQVELAQDTTDTFDGFDIVATV